MNARVLADRKCTVSGDVWIVDVDGMRGERSCFWSMLQAFALLPTMAFKGTLSYYDKIIIRFAFICVNLL